MRGFGFVGFFVGIVAMVGGKERERERWQGVVGVGA